MSRPHELASLLEIARDTLRGELAPMLDADARFKSAMVATALAIAARALRAGERSAGQERDALARLLATEPSTGLDELRRRMVSEIRAGRFDGPAERSLRACLRARIDARLAISNPDYRV